MHNVKYCLCRELIQAKGRGSRVLNKDETEENGVLESSRGSSKHPIRDASSVRESYSSRIGSAFGG